VDQYYAFTDSYGSMQQLGLWRSAKSEYQSEPYYDNIKCDLELRPQYWAYSLLTRHIGSGEIYPLTTGNEFVAASAFRDEQGKWVYIFANGSEEDFVATLENKALGKTKFSHYAYTKETLPQDDSLIEADDKISSRKGALEIAIEAQSVAVYVEK
jgi:alpha-galactosidase